jgi:5'-nucleotidase
VWSVVQIHSSRPFFIVGAVTLILLTNDDGIEAQGLRALEEALKDLARVIVVAPDQERSGVSHSLTLREPLKLRELESDRYILNGTPADCVIYALHHVLTTLPDLVIAGINHGANLGDDVMYSGTVAAAREASHRGIPSMAVSQAYYDGKPIRFKNGIAFIRKFVAAFMNNNFSGEICLNINFPVGKIEGIKITRQGCEEYMPHFNVLDTRDDSAAAPFRHDGYRKTDLLSDHKAILDSHVSITPMQRDQTDYRLARQLAREESWFFKY